MIGSLKISTKLMAAIGFVALIAAAIVGWVAYRDAERTFRNQAIAQLEAVRTSRARVITSYFERLHDDIRVAAMLPVTRQAFRDGPDRARTNFSPIASGLIDAYKLSDIILIDKNRRVVYARAKETRVGVAGSSPLAQPFDVAMRSPTPGAVTFIDFQLYAQAPAGFLMAPVFDTDNRALLGVIVYQLSLSEVSAIMSDGLGLGQTGEAYLIGSDMLMRTTGRLGDSTVLRRKVDTDAARRATAGETGTINQVGYRGVPVITTFAPVHLPGANWSIIASTDVAEMLAPIREFRTRAAFLLLALQSIVLSPVKQLSRGAARVAEHKYDQPVSLDTNDELGHLGRAFDTMMASVASQVGELQRDQQLLEAAPDGMVVIDKTGAIKTVNGASERLFGYTRAELLGQNVDVLVPDTVRGTHAGHRDLYVQKPAPRSMGTGRSLLGKRKDGSLVPVEISLSPLETADGLLIVAAVRDITERRKAEEELRGSEQRLEATATGANVGLWEARLDTGEILVNDIFERQLGYPTRGLRESEEKWAPLRGGLGAWPELLHPDDRERAVVAIQRQVAGETALYRVEHRVKAGDDSWKWILSVGRTSEHGTDGRATRVVGVHIDIGEMKDMQSALERRYGELQELQDLRDNLVHMIVHDMRSPLMGIQALFFFLKKEMDRLSDDTREIAVDSETATKTLIEMVSSLLDVSRLESGEMPLAESDVELGTVAEEAIGALSGLTAGRAVTTTRADGPVPSRCDADLIRSTIGNLLGNALKFTPSSASIVVLVKMNGERRRVEVRDTGPGIPPEFHARIFDKFGQADGGKQKKRHSSGLGLAFCKLAVEAHGGAIGVDSAVGQGSTFWFELPK